MASIERIEHVARRVIRAKNEGHDVVVVVSAMGKETDRLVELAEGADYQGLDARREMDVLLSTGEQVTISLLAMMLMKHGFQSESVLGRQANILTDKEHTRARILDIDASFLKSKLSDGVIPVVAGFQGTDDNGNITTLGRGGSDTTALEVVPGTYSRTLPLLYAELWNQGWSAPTFLQR